MILASAGLAGLTGASSLESQAWAQVEGKPPGESLGNRSDAEFWRDVRKGTWGTVSVPDKSSGMFIQSEGENWRAVRHGPVSVYGGWLLAAVIIVLAVFFAIRGRIRVEHGLSGRTIERFNAVERFAHWLIAISFIVLALTGLNILFGRYTLKPLLGPEVFATLTMAGKWAHNVSAFAFMIGLVMITVLWIRHNILDRYDLIWLLKGGGMFVKGVHPPAKKFNFGQK
ncbi:MAG: formate dehydrogenase subunit gamma, partial [Kiloniellales bacterium]